jgi:long-chain alkane monooxygenase
MADEYCEAVTRLWDSWELDAMIIDKDRAIFADPAKVHPVHFEGKYYSTRAARSPRRVRRRVIR